MDSAKKLCKDCKYFDNPHLMLLACTHPLATDTVIGEGGLSCFYVRSREGSCGPNAVLWEVKVGESE